MGIKPAELEQLEYQLAGLERERAALQRELGYDPGAHGERLATIAQESAELQSRHDDLQARWQSQKEAADEVVALRGQIDATQDDPALQEPLQEIGRAHV